VLVCAAVVWTTSKLQPPTTRRPTLSEILNVVYMSSPRTVAAISADLAALAPVLARVANAVASNQQLATLAATTISTLRRLCTAYRVLQTTFATLASAEPTHAHHVSDLRAYAWFLFLNASRALLGDCLDEEMAVCALICYCATFVLSQASAVARAQPDWIPTVASVKRALCTTHGMPLARYEDLESNFASQFLVHVIGSPVFKYANHVPLSDVLPWGKYEGALECGKSFMMSNLEQIRNRYAAALHESETEVDARLFVEVGPMGTCFGGLGWTN